MSAQEPQPCKNHPGVVAGWQCHDCQNQFCDQCITLRNFGQVHVSICRLCGGRCLAVGQQPVQSVGSPPAARKPSPVGLIVAAVAIVAGLAILGTRMLARNDSFPSVFALQPSAVHASASHPCVMKARCVVVYLAPWCPYCKRSIPMVEELRQRWRGGETGIMAVIGRDTPEQIQAMANKVGAGSYVDLDQSFWKQLDVQGVPVWFVINDQGELQNTVAGVPSDTSVLLAALKLE